MRKGEKMGKKLNMEILRAAMRVIFLWGLVTVLGLLITGQETSPLFSFGSALCSVGAIFGWFDFNTFLE
jgi:hypothetical protein